MILQFYAHISSFCTPLWRLFLRWRVRSGKESLQKLPERWGTASQKRPEGTLIWIHGASVGESLSVLGLIDALQKAFPHLVFLMTTGTRTSTEILKSRLPPRVIHQMLPCDIPHAITRFLDFWNPSLALFIESDLWPNLLALTQRRHIPTFLLNGRMSDRSFKRWKWFKPLLSPLLKNFKTCFVSSSKQADRLRALGAINIQITGNLKFTTSPLACDEMELKNLKRTLRKRPVWFAASTHPGEEELIFEAHRQLLKDFPNLLLILAPRHPHRIPEIEALASQNQMTTLRYSDEKDLSHCGIFLVDTLGDLGLFYRLSPLVFMGGSFVPVGGHNLVEPAQLGCAIFHGPLMEKNQDIADAFSLAKAACVVNGPEELAENIRLFFTNSDKQRQLVENSNHLALSQKRVLDKVTFLLRPWIHKQNA